MAAAKFWKLFELLSNNYSASLCDNAKPVAKGDLLNISWGDYLVLSHRCKFVLSPINTALLCSKTKVISISREQLIDLSAEMETGIQYLHRVSG